MTRPLSLSMRRLTARPTAHPAILLGALIGLLMIRLVVVIIGETPPPSDSRFNVEQAFDLARTGTLVEGDAPSMYREPLPVALYAVQIAIDPRLEGVEREELTGGGPALRALKQQHALWAAVLLAGVALQAWRLSARRLQVAAAAVLVTHVVLVEWVADYALTELHVAALLVWCGLLGQRWAVERRYRDAAAAGLLLGLATLVKSATLYIGPVYLLVVVALSLGHGRRIAVRMLAGAGVALLAMAVVVGPWMARNAATFDTWAVSDRGGLMLWMRAMYEDATPEERRGLWFEFAPAPLRPTVGALTGVSEEDLEGELRRIVYLPQSDSDGGDTDTFYLSAREDRRELTDAYLAAGVQTRPQARVLADLDLRSAGLEVLLRDPGSFLRTVPVFLWRGLWPVRAVPLVPVPVLGLLTPLGMLALLVVGTTALVRLRPARFAVVGLPFGFVVFSALLTIYEPRSSEVVVPTMVLLLIVGAERAFDRLFGPQRGAVAS